MGDPGVRVEVLCREEVGENVKTLGDADMDGTRLFVPNHADCVGFNEALGCKEAAPLEVGDKIPLGLPVILPDALLVRLAG